MTLAPTIPTPTANRDPMVFARGSTGGRRLAVALAGLASAAVALACFAVGHGVGLVLAGVPAAALLSVAAWRRGRGFEVRREGVRLLDGGRLFGERTLVPWESVVWFGTRPARTPGRVRLAYRQQHVRGERALPGGTLDADAADRLLDRLRFLLAARHPNLRIGGM